MNKTAIKNFAIAARHALIDAVTQKAFEYEVTENGVNNAQQTTVNGRAMTSDEQTQRSELINRINMNGFAQTMEEAAYTWFNRFIALRFMEVNGYMPSRVRVFSDENNAFKPEILSEAMHLELTDNNGKSYIDHEYILDLLDKQQNDVLYKYLIIAQCNALNNGLPEMFEEIGGWTELLFPNNLLRNDSLLAHMVEDIPEEDWRDQVQIIGWLYQYYNTEPKDKVFADLKKNIKISAAAIPAATQLFTPDWIVRYMVENSLGRLWTEGHGKPANADWQYYLEEAEQEDSVKAELEKLRAEYKNIQPEQIRVIDPCMGSGHILVYAFDVLMDIYTSCGWSERDAAVSILQNNLYGLDIDRRAYQLAYFAVMMKARQYNRSIIKNGEVQPQLANFADVMGVDTEMLSGTLKEFAEQFRYADTYGSLMEITAPKGLDEAVSEFSVSFGMSRAQLEMMMKIYKYLSQKYDVVVTNPPYMGINNMGGKLCEYILDKHESYKHDLYCVFINVCRRMLKNNGYQAMITQQSFMFNSRYEKARLDLIHSVNCINLLHLGARAFDEINGEVVQTATFVFGEGLPKEYIGTFVDLQEASCESEKKNRFINRSDSIKKICYYANFSMFQNIEKCNFSYWLSKIVIDLLVKEKRLSLYADTRHGLVTGNGDLFMRLWYEVDLMHIVLDDSTYMVKKWFPYCKGGTIRRWYGNRDYIVNWENNGHFIKNYRDDSGNLKSSNYNENYNFLCNITWTDLSTGLFSARFTPKGSLFDTSGPALFLHDQNNTLYLLAFMNTKVMQKFLDIFCIGLHYSPGSIGTVPLILQQDETIKKIAEKNVQISKIDWDSFETSWDFEQHPLLAFRNDVSPIYDSNVPLKERLIPNLRLFENHYGVEVQQTDDISSRYSHLDMTFQEWEKYAEKNFNQLKANEEELNRIFIEIYGLQDELTPKVEDKDVTVRRADLTRDIKSLISYAVGCLFGRYSVDTKGLCYAGGDWDASKYKTIIPDSDNVIPICDDDYLEDDLTVRVVEFVKKVYGEDTLEENLRFIADALGGKGSPREVIRNYLLTGFFADHCRIYQKRPIYWLFSSGKKNGFKALVYMHRWQKTTVATVRTDYVHELQERYRTQLSLIEEQMQTAAASEHVKLKKRQDKLQAQLTEINDYEEKVHHLADMMIDIDLDDGVKVNYAKFEDILEKIK